MKKLITITALLLATSLAIPANAQTAQTTQATQTADDSARLESVLRAFEATPSREQLEANIPDASKLLIQAANDTKRDLFTRLRATSLLINFETPESRDALIALTKNSEFELRRMAYYILGRTFGASTEQLAGNNLMSVLEHGTRDKHPDVRAHTVRSLRWVKNPAADKLLESIAADSKDTALRDLAQQTLNRKTPAATKK